MEKRDYNYLLKIQADTQTYVEIRPPFALDFKINRNNLSAANTATIKVANLNESTRKKIYKDQYNLTLYKGVELYAGYGNNLALVFKGNIKRAFSQRVGVDFWTEIQAYDGGFAMVNGYTSVTFNKGLSGNYVLDLLVKDLPNINKGVVGSGFEQEFQRAVSISDDTWKSIQVLTDGKAYIDCEKLYVLKENECIRGNLLEISSDTGLLSTPLREDTWLQFKIMFEPRLLIGQAVKLISSTEKNFNGEYKVIGVRHTGKMYFTAPSQCTTEVNLWYGNQLTVMK